MEKYYRKTTLIAKEVYETIINITVIAVLCAFFAITVVFSIRTYSFRERDIRALYI